MSIQGISEKGKFRALFVPVLIMCTAIASFGLGRLSVVKQERPPLAISSAVLAAPAPAAQAAAPSAALPANSSNSVAPENQPAPSSQTGAYVASRTGTSYYLPWCATAKRILDKNKVWFATKQEAEKAGYKPASNCKGI